jgi:hypothetical protein
MRTTITLRCSQCNARIKAPVQMLGQSRPCPGCGARLHVRIQPPQDSDPVLVVERQPRGERPVDGTHCRE